MRIADAIPDTAQVAASELSIVEGLMNKMRTFFKNPPNGVLASEPEQRAPSGRRLSGGSSASSLNPRSTFTFLALLAALAVALLFLLPGAFVQAQGAEQSFIFAENGDGPVATFTASDPEDVSPIVWSLLDDPTGDQDLGIFTDTNTDGNDDSDDDVVAAGHRRRSAF